MSQTPLEPQPAIILTPPAWTPKRVETFGGVQVAEFEPNWDDLAWSVLSRHFHCPANPGRPTQVGRIAKILFSTLPPTPTVAAVFANPRFTVFGTAANSEYQRRRETACKRWMAEYRQIAGSKEGLKDRLAMSDVQGTSRRETLGLQRLLKQLEYSGIEFIDGRHRPVRNGQPVPTSIEAGQTFGRLTVEGSEPRGICVCRCKCGNTTRVRRQHLVSGRTKSCGCWKKEIDERRQRRKEAHCR